MIRAILTLALIAAVIFGLNSYLQPDDIGACVNKKTICQTADAVVAISGGDTSARANEAIKIYKDGLAKKIIFSGAAQDKSGPSNAMAMKSLALDAGVSEADILLDEEAEMTRQNAINVQEIFLKNDIKSAILVTSGYHQRRASLEFNKYAKNVEILNHPVSTDKDWSGFWWMTLRGWYLAISEVVKIGVFYVVGLVS